MNSNSPTKAPAAHECRLLAGPAAASAQIALAIVVLASLLFKRHRERPQRPLQIWLLDVSKQAVSSGAAHICGMIFAIIASSHASTQASECAWYFVIFSLDTTLGVALAVAMHNGILITARHLDGKVRRARARSMTILKDVVSCGDYGTPPSYRRWAVQMVEWTAVVLAARVVCGLTVVLTNRVLVVLAELLDKAFKGHPVVLLFFVMIACPLGMNLVQAWVQDAVLKWKKSMAVPYAPVAETRMESFSLHDDGTSAAPPL